MDRSSQRAEAVATENDTIFAVASGQPPAAIAIMRISGPRAFAAATALAGPLPPPRHASLRALRDPLSGDVLDVEIVDYH